VAFNVCGCWNAQVNGQNVLTHTSVKVHNLLLSYTRLELVVARSHDAAPQIKHNTQHHWMSVITNWHLQLAQCSSRDHATACVVNSLCPVSFSSPATLRLPSITLATPLTGGTSRPWSGVPTGTVVEQIACCFSSLNVSIFHICV